MAQFFRCLALGFTGLVILAGCNSQQQSDVNAAVKDVGTTVKEVGKEAKGGLKQGQKVAADTLLSGHVKTAMVASSKLDSSQINVDANVAGKTVVLRGTVPDAGQKALAERVAKDTVPPGTILTSQLKIKAA